jgi:hypothetical protein
MENNRRVVRRIDPSHVHEFRKSRRTSDRVAHRVNRESHVPRGRGATIMPPQVRRETQLKHPSVAGPRPGTGEVWSRLQRVVIARERYEERVTLNLSCQHVQGHQRVCRLEIRTRGDDDGATPLHR